MRRDRLFRAVAYFRRGYSLVAFMLSFTNFIILTYKFVIEPWLGHDMLLLIIYVLSMGLVVATACVMLGRWDYRRGTFKYEALVNVLNNPAWRDLFTALYYIASRQNEKALAVLKKYMSNEQSSSTSVHHEEQCH